MSWGSILDYVCDAQACELSCTWGLDHVSPATSPHPQALSSVQGTVTRVE